MTCPRCGGPLTLGQSRVRIREDGTLAHVKCDAHQPTQKATSPPAAPAPARSAPAADERPVAVVWRHLDPFRYEVTDQSGERIWTGPSGTLLGQWRRTRPDLQIVQAAALFAAVRAMFGQGAPTTVVDSGNMTSMKQKRQRRRQEH